LPPLLHNTLALLATLFSLAALPALAQTYPARTVTIINPYAPGGGVDPVARLLAGKLTERLGQQFIVENKMGAAGMLGADLVAKAKPDGYTLLMSASNDVAINQHLYKNIRYNAERDFAPITQLVQLPMVLVVNPKVPAKTLAEFIALAKAKPGGLTYASPGNGTLQHLIAARLQSVAGIQMLHVPYKERLTVDLIGGQVDAAFLGAPVVAPFVKDGRLRALAVTSPQRIGSAPDIPTAAEQGMAGLEVTQWFGAYAPAGTPEPIVRLLQREMAAVLALPEVRASLAAQGAEAVGSTPEAFAKFLKAEIERFGLLVKQSGATVEQ
jgi:tripartite-type tricarboxylate transporter receptor subunit TctC